jgi:hypothetical protein
MPRPIRHQQWPVSFMDRTASDLIFSSKTPRGTRVTGRVTVDRFPDGDHWQATAEGKSARGNTRLAAVINLLAVIDSVET